MKEPEKIERIVFRTCACIVVLGLAYVHGVRSVQGNLFPYPQIMSVLATGAEVLGLSRNLLLDLQTEDNEAIVFVGEPEELGDGLVLIAHAVAGTRDTRIDVMDRQGDVVHSWMPLWDDIWPPEQSAIFDSDKRPVPGDGHYLHGVDILPDGSIVANFEHLSSFRMDACGNLMWKLPNLGHHAVHYAADDDTIWITAEIDEAVDEPSMFKVRNWVLQQLSTDGQVLREISVTDVLKINGLTGLLHLSTLAGEDVAVVGDTLHLNDVDVFPAHFESDIFAPGDIMFSLRNINAIFVIDPDTLKIKFQSVGQVLRQHDPDFTPDGDITIFDNNNLRPSITSEDGQSYILHIDSKTGAVEKLVGEAPDGRFYTTIMGTHQVLGNGNILVNSSGQGRVYEYGGNGRLLWRWSNLGQNDSNNRVYAAIGLPPEMNAAFFARVTAQCNK